MDQSVVNIPTRNYIDSILSEHTSFDNARKSMKTIISILLLNSTWNFIILWFDVAKSRGIFTHIFFFFRRNHIETYKITEKYDTWHLHHHLGTIMSFSDLPDLAKSIKILQNHRPLRVTPSDYGM